MNRNDYSVCWGVSCLVNVITLRVDCLLSHMVVDSASVLEYYLVRRLANAARALFNCEQEENMYYLKNEIHNIHYYYNY